MGQHVDDALGEVLDPSGIANEGSRIATKSESKNLIAARKMAEEVIELVDVHDEQFKDRFWTAIIAVAKVRRLVKQNDDSSGSKADKKMSDVEAKRFGREEMPFGEFAGAKTIANVPLDRLRWYADQDFIDRLRRYLRSDYVKREQPNEDD